jgi:hypothetical protein
VQYEQQLRVEMIAPSASQGRGNRRQNRVQVLSPLRLTASDRWG